MNTIEVRLAPHFSAGEIHVGTLLYERVRGSGTFIFEYDSGFLRAYPQLRLSADLHPYSGKQSASGRIFACFSDALPDRWGRSLINKRERLMAKEQNRMPRTFDDLGYLLQLDDESRMGAFRFYEGGALVGERSDRNIPIVAELNEIIRYSHEYERAELTGGAPRSEWIENLWAQGSSLGGARPKATVIDGEGRLCIAKIPSIKDEYDVELWEYFAMKLARKAGIVCPESSILKLGGSPFHTLLSRRFDRTAGGRIHYASSMTLAGLDDGDNARDGHGYLDIVNTIVGDNGVVNPYSNIRELYRRIAYNICIGNHDDHFRNHGFLLGTDGWSLSPAFDLNPSLNVTQTLLISESSNNSSLQELVNAAEYYLIEPEEALQIINDVQAAVSDWRKVAEECGIPSGEQERFATRLDFYAGCAITIDNDLENVPDW